MSYVVDAMHVTKQFKSSSANEPVIALSDVTFKAESGKITALIGPDSAGKTTFLRMVCGLLFPSKGHIKVLGKDVVTQAQEIQDCLGYMPQKFGLYEDLTCMENMNLYADLHGVSMEKRQLRFEKLFHMTGLLPFTNRLAGKLSGGMKQKLGLACTLVRTPDLLLLDEPTVGVDPLSRRELWEIIKTLVKEEAISVLVSTAYMEEAELCDKVCLLHEGALLAESTPAAFRAQSEGLSFWMPLPKNIPARVVQAALLDDTEHIEDAVPERGGVRFVQKKGIKQEQIKALSYYPGCTPQAVSSPLEDSFMMLFNALKKEGSSCKEFPIDYKKEQHIANTVEIYVENLLRTFGDFVAVDRTSFTVRKGEIFGLLGPNGAGKSTTFKMLCGLLPASGGTLSVAGVNLRIARAAARANIGYVAQKFSLYSTLSVFENLWFFGGVYGIPPKKLRERIQAVLHMFHLEGKEQDVAGRLPLGYKQRLSMAAGLLHEPKILFLDEPTSGIDPLARRAFWRQISALAEQGITIIITTHFMDEAEYCDRIMIQDQGKTIVLGTPDEIRKEAGENLTMNEAFVAIVEKNRHRKEM